MEQLMQVESPNVFGVMNEDAGLGESFSQA
jgi:hypothetical protein